MKGFGYFFFPCRRKHEATCNTSSVDVCVGKARCGGQCWGCDMVWLGHSQHGDMTPELLPGCTDGKKLVAENNVGGGALGTPGTMGMCSVGMSTPEATRGHPNLALGLECSITGQLGHRWLWEELGETSRGIFPSNPHLSLSLSLAL